MALSGPTLPPARGPATHLVVLVHGYGADGNDLIEIGKQWQPWLPDAAFVAPHAPEPCGMSPMGRQWFGLTFRDPHERWRGVVQARPTLDAFLDAELARTGVAPSKLALVGFSQGTMMSLHAGLRRAVQPAAILGYSGMLVEGPEQPGEARQNYPKPPSILLAHGEEDEIIPVEALMMSANALAAGNIPVQWHLSAGLGHGIDQTGLVHGALFLAQSFGVNVNFGAR